MAFLNNLQTTTAQPGTYPQQDSWSQSNYGNGWNQTWSQDEWDVWYKDNAVPDSAGHEDEHDPRARSRSADRCKRNANDAA